MQSNLQTKGTLETYYKLYCFVRGCLLLRGSKCIRTNYYLGPWRVYFVKRLIILHVCRSVWNFNTVCNVWVCYSSNNYIHTPPTTNQPTHTSLDIVIPVDLTCPQDVWVNCFVNINLACDITWTMFMDTPQFWGYHYARVIADNIAKRINV